MTGNQPPYSKCGASVGFHVLGGKSGTYTIDWSGISVRTCTCLCGAVFRGKAKFVGKGEGEPRLHTEKVCPRCSRSCTIIQAISDPETWEVRLPR